MCVTPRVQISGPAHDAAYWERQTRGFDFSGAGRVPADLNNEVLWQGLKGDKPYPTLRAGSRFGKLAVMAR